MTKDGADLHVERWRDHWVLDKGFDDDVEAMTVRIGTIQKWFKTTTKDAVATVGLQDFEYDTLHALMIRDTPGRASPGELAQEMGVSNAGVTGRLESMEKKGWLKRMPGAADRRRVEVEATREGLRLWREAMALRGSAEHDVGTALTRRELATLNKLLKKMTLYIEARGSGGPRAPAVGAAAHAKRSVRVVDRGRSSPGKKGPGPVGPGPFLRNLGGSVDHLLAWSPRPCRSGRSCCWRRTGRCR